MKQVNVRLDDQQIAVLKGLGGYTQGIGSLIKAHNPIETESKPEPPTMDMRFFEKIMIPKEKNLKATYIAYLNSYLKRGIKSEAIGYSINEIMGETGFDEATIRKQFRKLTGSSYMRLVQGSMFRPTIRLYKGTDREEFALILEEYITFLRGEADYEDVLGDLDDEC